MWLAYIIVNLFKKNICILVKNSSANITHKISCKWFKYLWIEDDLWFMLTELFKK